MSRWDRTVELVAVEYEQDAERRQVPVDRPRRVFCNELSVGAEAYYAAAQAGHAMAARIEVRACEYRGERVCVYGGRRLVVARAQGSGADYVRLDLEEEVGERCQ